MPRRESAAKSENVQVCVRVRPLSQKERDGGCAEVVTTDLAQNTVTVAVDPEFKTFSFDQIYNKQFTQKDIYLRTAHPVVESVLEGYNATIFAYGQSGTGKTYTMSGVIGTPEQGVIPNALQHIFEHIEATGSDRVQHTVMVSFVELYNGKCRDLLTDKKRPLELKENAQKLFYVKDLEKVKITGGMLQCMRLMEEGSTRREVGATNLNQDSSRSHSVFTIEVTALNQEHEPPTTCVSKLNLVDLAGSERQSKTGADGAQLKEGSNINLSLSALGTVIDVLVKGRGHIPFRCSPLTMLLKDSLGGNSRTVMFATVGPADMNTQETMSTLRFADRAKQIKNKPKQQLDPKDALILSLREEVEALRRRLGGAADDSAQDRAAELEVELCVLRQELEQLREDSGRSERRAAEAEARGEERAEAAALSADLAEGLRQQLLELSRAVRDCVTAALPESDASAWAAEAGGDPAADPLPAGAARDGIRRALRRRSAARPAGRELAAPPGTDALTLLERHGGELGVEARAKLADSLRDLEAQFAATLAKVTAERDALLAAAAAGAPAAAHEQPPRGRGAREHSVGRGAPAPGRAPAPAARPSGEAAAAAPGAEADLLASPRRVASPRSTSEGDGAGDAQQLRAERDEALAQLAAARSAMERAQRTAQRQTAQADRLRSETADLARRLVATEQRFRSDLEAAQSALIAENARRLENLMVGHAEELSRQRKHSQDAKKKVKRLREQLDELSGSFDAKVVEYEQLLRDYEELKVRNLQQQRDAAASPTNWLQGKGEYRVVANARLAALCSEGETIRQAHSAPPYSHPVSVPAYDTGPATSRVEKGRRPSVTPAAISHSDPTPPGVPTFARPPLPSLPNCTPPDTELAPQGMRPLPPQGPSAPNAPRGASVQQPPPPFAKAPLGALSGSGGARHPQPPSQRVDSPPNPRTNAGSPRHA